MVSLFVMPNLLRIVTSFFLWMLVGIIHLQTMSSIRNWLLVNIFLLFRYVLKEGSGVQMILLSDSLSTSHFGLLGGLLFQSVHSCLLPYSVLFVTVLIKLIKIMKSQMPCYKQNSKHCV